MVPLLNIESKLSHWDTCAPLNTVGRPSVLRNQMVRLLGFKGTPANTSILILLL